jgi:hypothetical protein
VTPDLVLVLPLLPVVYLGLCATFRILSGWGPLSEMFRAKKEPLGRALEEEVLAMGYAWKGRGTRLIVVTERPNPARGERLKPGHSGWRAEYL